MKDYEKLSMRDHFMFGKICLKPENSQLILRALLGEEIDIVSTDIEKYLKIYKDTKYVRLDLLAKDDEGNIYNGELQHESANKDVQKELPLRVRYYQAVIDSATVLEGSYYKNLPHTYIIFICTYDPFGKGLYKYTFTSKCAETEIEGYDDKAKIIFYNTKADLHTAPQELRNMLQYIETGEIFDTATKCLDSEVRKARLREEWRTEYMLTLVHDNDVYNEGYNSGYDSGYGSGYDSGYDSRQDEVDSLKSKIEEMAEVIAKLHSENEETK